ncbi:MAG: site-specific integrase [Firmicutes bacterium]|nr:site-specific integrase [Bacillota bacterium]
MSTIVKRGSSYQFKAYGTDIYGRPCRKTTTWTPPPGMTTKQAAKAAERAAAIFEEECKRGRIVDGNITLQEYYETQWRETRAINLAAKTLKGYDELFVRVAAHPISKTPLKAINAHVLNVFYKYLREKCANAHNGAPLSPSTLRAYHRFLSSILTGALKDGYIDENPCRKAEPPKVPQSEAACMQPDNVNRLIAALADEPLMWRTLITAYIYTGARKSELLGVTWDKYNSDTGALTIDCQLNYVEGQPLALTPTKTRSTRTVRLPASLIALLGAWYYEQCKWKDAVGDEWGTGYGRTHAVIENAPPNAAWIFTDEYGNPVHPKSVLKHFRSVLKKAGLPETFNVHSLRHSNASSLIAQNVPLSVVAGRLGHASTATTQAVYSHQIQRTSDLAVDVLEALYEPIE